jgi:glycosyltransferase involved in cell wall biosynthesis
MVGSLGGPVATARPGAAEWLPGLQLRIVGPLVDPDAVARGHARIRESGLEDRVTLTGPVSQGDLLEEYRRAELLVLASREETAPQVIAQAMACGLPVVSSAGGGVPHMVRDGETALLFPIGDVAAGARCLRRLLDDDALRAGFGERSRSEARRRFHPDAVADQTIAVYRQVLAEA